MEVVANGKIAFADEDDGQLFGLPAPLNGEAEAEVWKVLSDYSIIDAMVDLETSDLTLRFSDKIRLDVFN